MPRSALKSPLVGGILALSLLPSLHAQQLGQTFSTDQIPDRLLSGAFPGKLRAGFQCGDVTFIAGKKAVHFAWVASALTNSLEEWTTTEQSNLGNNAIGNAHYQDRDQDVSTSFYVTAVGRLDQHSLLVAGIHRIDGSTVVKRWDFIWPDPMPSPVVDPDTGLSEVEVVLPGVQSASVFSNYLSPGLPRYPSGICGIRGPGGLPTDKALIQFAEPNDIYVLGLSTGTMSRLLSAIPPGGSLGVASSLQLPGYHGIKVYDHSSLGYIYFITTGSTQSHEPYGGLAGITDQTPRLHLVDGDRNGTIDSILQLSTDDAEAAGLLDLSNYSNWWLE